ncbi:sulfatase [Algoriphagus resistens]|uniref:sulfatase n=1 Tax=Algoriphagus resistens TaxID=1750590 RepID=UPI0007168D47|nr:sulfatase [Algoriphagus resistens]
MKDIKLLDRLGKLILLSFCFLGTFLGAKGRGEAVQDIPEKPNILLIYVDDLGYGDIPNYPGSISNSIAETPNIGQLIQSGMSFTNAYSSAPLCSAARAALLTGKSPARLGFEFVTKYEKDSLGWDAEQWVTLFKNKKLISPPITLNLPLGEETMAEGLKKSGYETGIVGKWHVASHHKVYKGWSLTHGPAQQGFDTAKETFGAHPYSGMKSSPQLNKGEYPEDLLTSEAVKFIEKKHDSPFFLMVSHYFVHTPHLIGLQWIEEKYKTKLNRELTEGEVRYAANVELLDHYVGQVVQALENSGLKENTVVLFTSDNGGHPDYAHHAPFRGSKWNLYEAGIRIPMVISWPGVIKANSLQDTPVIQTDFFPTFMALAGNFSQEPNELDGQSILPLLTGNTFSREKPLYWYFPYYHPEGGAYDEALTEIGVEDGKTSQTRPQAALRKGSMKLVYFFDTEQMELYDLKSDPAESHDLSTTRQWDAKLMKEDLLNRLYAANARFPRNNPQTY